MKTNDSQGDLTDMSANTKALLFIGEWSAGKVSYKQAPPSPRKNQRAKHRQQVGKPFGYYTMSKRSKAFQHSESCRVSIRYPMLDPKDEMQSGFVRCGAIALFSVPVREVRCAVPARRCVWVSSLIVSRTDFVMSDYFTWDEWCGCCFVSEQDGCTCHGQWMSHWEPSSWSSLDLYTTPNSGAWSALRCTGKWCAEPQRLVAITTGKLFSNLN